jgi:hypothetical protein
VGPLDRRGAVQRRDLLQRFFSTFPGSWPGVGLLLLRGFVGAAAAAQGATYLASVEEPGAGAWLLGMAAVATGGSLLIGFLTPGAGVVAALSTVLIAVAWYPLSDSSLFLVRAVALFVVADAAALVLLGPGALSLDAYLFGRREIVIPHDSHPRS